MDLLLFLKPEIYKHKPDIYYQNVCEGYNFSMLHLSEILRVAEALCSSVVHLT